MRAEDTDVEDSLRPSKTAWRSPKSTHIKSGLDSLVKLLDFASITGTQQAL
jgi:hypothetical protein